ncbi:MFS transporter [Streptomyces sp. 8L]|uniref:MFS transporter n=1 Tax=Streptomyces sp. 8L TaxID=2877242 RepID=UPI001CD64A7C|nr:MFS transporter [Streptomyces sp. 8L]MCA1217034.1 MHS family MFS transporter [Streptomyces sp. 8L]
MNGSTTVTPAPRRNAARVLASSTMGSVIEWYDYNIYATSAAVAFPTVFFPHSTPFIGAMQSFATFAASFLLRPLGALVFGHFGDRHGRKTSLVVTIVVMGVSTVCIGLIPSAHTIGAAAPALLVFFRLVQGIALGGEWGGAVLMTTEHADSGRRGLWGSLPQIGSPAANLCASGMMALAAFVSGGAFTQWGWRIPFLAGAVLLAVGLVMRLTVSDSPAFQEIKEQGHTSRFPLVSLFRHDTRNLLLATGSRIGVDVAYYTFATYSLSYLTANLHLDTDVGLIALAVGAACEIVVIPLMGLLSDRIGRKKVFLAGLTVFAAWSFLFFPLLDSGSQGLAVLAFAVALGLGHASTWGVMGSLYPELFRTQERYTGASFSFQLAGIFGGALAPFIATALVASSLGTGGVTAYLLAATALSAGCLMALPETFRSRLRGESTPVGLDAPAATETR